MKPNRTRHLLYALLILPVAAVAAALALIPAGSHALPNQSQAQSDRVHLPVIHHGLMPTPPPTPPPAPYSAAATLTITPRTEINASTFNPSSFIVANESLNGERLTELRIDLSTALFPDMVFDPHGQAGDVVAKDVEVDRISGVSFDHAYEGPHDDGYDVLVLTFGGFDRNDRFEFSVDVDPTSIRGVAAPGPHETGSVGGLELVGSTITATFDDGTVLTNQVYRMDDGGSAGSAHSGAVAHMRPGLPGRPLIEIPGVVAPAAVSQPGQTVRVSGPVGRPVVVLVVEGGLFTAGVPGGGFDIDPFEANTALTVREYSGVIGPAGVADVPVTLTRVLGEGGINHITAVFDNHYGIKGLTAEPLVLQLQ